MSNDQDQATLPFIKLSSPSSSLPDKSFNRSSAQTVDCASTASALDYNLEPARTYDEIIKDFASRYEQCRLDYADYDSDHAFRSYVSLGNLNRSNRNAWLIFKQHCEVTFSDKRALMWCNDRGEIEEEWTYGELGQRVKKLAFHLQSSGIKVNDRVLLSFPPGLQFIVTFWACLSLGVIPMPICPFDPFALHTDQFLKFQHICIKTEPKAILTERSWKNAVDMAKQYNDMKQNKEVKQSVEDKKRIESLQHLDLTSIDDFCNAGFDAAWSYPSSIHAENGVELAFIQFSSGSTSTPHGVVIGHCNVVDNVLQVAEQSRLSKSFRHYANSTVVTFLPHFHDMGLIGTYLTPLLLGQQVIAMSPLTFLNEPLTWLKVCSDATKRYGIEFVSTAAPCFALELCVKRFKLHQTNTSHFLQQLNLTGLHTIIVGAEPVQLQCLSAFAHCFADFGFSANAFMPCYGLAECVVFVSGKRDNTYTPHAVCVDAVQLANKRRIQEIDLTNSEDSCANCTSAKWLVSCGERCAPSDPMFWKAFPDSTKVLIVDPTTCRPLSDGCVGEIWIFSKSCAVGYYNDADATNDTFMGRLMIDALNEEEVKAFIPVEFWQLNWLRSGDLGVWYQDQLYITGRLKDVLIFNGQKVYCHDIEQTVRECNLPHIRSGGILATAHLHSVKDEAVLMLEVSENGKKKDVKIQTRKMLPLVNRVIAAIQRLPSNWRPALIRVAKRFMMTMQHNSSTAQVEGQDASNDSLMSAESLLTHLIRARHGVLIDEIVWCQPHTLLKTTSGKLQRTQNQLALANRQFEKQIIRRSKRGMLEIQNDISEVETLVNQSRNIAAVSKVSQRKTHIKSNASTQSTAADTEPTTSTTQPTLDFDIVKQRLTTILSQELELDKEEILQLAAEVKIDESFNLESFGFDSLTLMRIASKINTTFQLPVPLSPFMLIKCPTLDGLTSVIVKLSALKGVGQSAAQIQQSKIKAAAQQEISSDENSPSVDYTIDSSISTPLSKTLSCSNVTADHVLNSVSTVKSAVSGSTSSLPLILGLGCCVPGSGAPQAAITDAMIRHFQMDDSKSKLFAKIASTSGVQRRYTVLNSIDGMFFGKKGIGNDECIERRNQVFKEEAPKLATIAAEKAIADWGADRSLITHCVAVTCTGVIVPGLEFHLMQALGLKVTCQRLAITFMGCFGAVSGMKVAAALAKETVHNRVLLVCCELCSLHTQMNERIDNLIGSTLFADGAAAAIIGCQNIANNSNVVDSPSSTVTIERPLYEIHKSSSLILPNSIDMMDWILTNTGMSIGLGRAIPETIYEGIDEFMCQLLDNTDAFTVPFTRMKFAIHPGGPMIIQAICQRLGIATESIPEVWKVLRNYGNMSSATLLFVLDEIRKSENGVLEAWVPCLAFGPGLNVEGTLLRRWAERCEEQA